MPYAVVLRDRWTLETSWAACEWAIGQPGARIRSFASDEAASAWAEIEVRKKPARPPPDAEAILALKLPPLPTADTPEDDDDDFVSAPDELVVAFAFCVVSAAGAVGLGAVLSCGADEARWRGHRCLPPSSAAAAAAARSEAETELEAAAFALEAASTLGGGSVGVRLHGCSSSLARVLKPAAAEEPQPQQNSLAARVTMLAATLPAPLTIVELPAPASAAASALAALLAEARVEARKAVATHASRSELLPPPRLPPTDRAGTVLPAVPAPAPVASSAAVASSSSSAAEQRKAMPPPPPPLRERPPNQSSPLRPVASRPHTSAKRAAEDDGEALTKRPCNPLEAPPDARAPDAGAPDARAPDAGAPDAGAPAAALPTAAPPAAAPPVEAAAKLEPPDAAAGVCRGQRAATIDLCADAGDESLGPTAEAAAAEAAAAWRQELAKGADGVEITGERTREQRDALARQYAVDVDAAPPRRAAASVAVGGAAAAAAANPSAEMRTETSSGGWACVRCTYAHAPHEAAFLSCAMCGLVRAKQPKRSAATAKAAAKRHVAAPAATSTSAATSAAASAAHTSMAGGRELLPYEEAELLSQVMLPLDLSHDLPNELPCALKASNDLT